MSVGELLDQLTRSVPRLPGAACRRDPHLFDLTDRDDPAVERAKSICESCPALNRCRRWLRGTPPALRPSGAVGGRFIPPPRLPPEPRPRTSPSRDHATDWLRGYLAQHAPVLSTQVLADAAAAGISLSTLHWARHDLGVRRERVRGVRGAPHTWV